jgi:hypothetical protein
MKFNVSVITVKPTHERTDAEKATDKFPPDLVTVQASKGDKIAGRQKTYTLVVEDNKYAVGQKLRLEDRREKGKQGLTLFPRA